MLHKETVSESTLELLKKLMDDKLLSDFFLVGGTALALQIGHRISIDLDLFSTNEFNVDEILVHLEENYCYQLDYRWKNTLKGSISDVKVDLISHSYPKIDELLMMEGVRMASLKEISAMKLNAISDNGTRLKDFVDLAYMSSFLNFKQMIDAFSEKYASRNPAMLVKAVGYHYDIDFTEAIDMLGGKYDWTIIERRIKMMTLQPERLFPPVL